MCSHKFYHFEGLFDYLILLIFARFHRVFSKGIESYSIKGICLDVLKGKPTKQNTLVSKFLFINLGMLKGESRTYKLVHHQW